MSSKIGRRAITRNERKKDLLIQSAACNRVRHVGDVHKDIIERRNDVGVVVEKWSLVEVKSHRPRIDNVDARLVLPCLVDHGDAQGIGQEVVNAARAIELGA